MIQKGKSMNKYEIFRKMLDCAAEVAEVKDASMNNWRNSIEVTGASGDQTITIEVTIGKRGTQDSKERCGSEVEPA